MHPCGQPGQCTACNSSVRLRSSAKVPQLHQKGNSLQRITPITLSLHPGAVQPSHCPPSTGSTEISPTIRTVGDHDTGSGTCSCPLICPGKPGVVRPPQLAVKRNRQIPWPILKLPGDPFLITFPFMLLRLCEFTFIHYCSPSFFTARFARFAQLCFCFARPMARWTLTPRHRP